MTLPQAEARFARLKPGGRIVYHFGDLQRDRDPSRNVLASLKTVRSMDRLARYFYSLACPTKRTAKSAGHLAQIRLGTNQYVYLFIKAKRETDTQ